MSAFNICATKKTALLDMLRRSYSVIRSTEDIMHAPVHDGRTILTSCCPNHEKPLIATARLKNLESQSKKKCFNVQSFYISKKIPMLTALFLSSYDKDALETVSTPLAQSLGWGFEQELEYQSITDKPVLTDKDANKRLYVTTMLMLIAQRLLDCTLPRDAHALKGVVSGHFIMSYGMRAQLLSTLKYNTVQAPLTIKSLGPKIHVSSDPRSVCCVHDPMLAYAQGLFLHDAQKDFMTERCRQAGIGIGAHDIASVCEATSDCANPALTIMDLEAIAKSFAE